MRESTTPINMDNGYKHINIYHIFVCELRACSLSLICGSKMKHLDDFILDHILFDSLPARGQSYKWIIFSILYGELLLLLWFHFVVIHSLSWWWPWKDRTAMKLYFINIISSLSSFEGWDYYCSTVYLFLVSVASIHFQAPSRVGDLRRSLTVGKLSIPLNWAYTP
jgi:hypothetical protein